VSNNSEISHKNWGKIAPGVPPNSAKMFFVSLVQFGLLATYPARMLIIFETTDMSWCVGAYSCDCQIFG